MMKVMIGLLLGVSLSAGTGYMMLPKVKQAAYNEGAAAGTKAGQEAGMAAGITKGREQAKAEYQREQEVAQATASAKEKQRRQVAAEKQRRAPKPIQNWHVIGNQLGEPIGDETPTVKGDADPV